jgi:hypothetical protein
MKKPFKETKFGKLLIEKVPEAAGLVGDLLPDNGLLGIVKNIIDTSTISPSEKRELLAEGREFEFNELKLYLEDKQDARHREVELAKTGKPDILMMATGFTLMVGFLLNIVGLTFFEIPEGNRDSILHAQGIIEGGFIGGMVFYYFGASKK